MASSKKIEKLEESRKKALARARDTAKKVAAQQQHTLIALGSAFAIGKMEAEDVKLPTIRKVDPKLLYGVISLGAGYMLKDKKTRAIAQSVGDGLLAIVAYNQAKGIDAVGDEYDPPAVD